MKGLKEKAKDLTWYLADKLIVPATTLLGIGAATGLKEGGLETVVHAIKYPYELLFAKGLVPEVIETLYELTGSMTKYPKTTIGCIAGTYAAGKIGKYFAEKKRLKTKYSTGQES
jgi:hypothetical protein